MSAMEDTHVPHYPENGGHSCPEWRTHMSPGGEQEDKNKKPNREE